MGAKLRTEFKLISIAGVLPELSSDDRSTPTLVPISCCLSVHYETDGGGYLSQASVMIDKIWSQHLPF
jgi:hypothetical protein